MKIVQLKAANVKRLSAVEINPDGTLVVVGGNNGAGKSSVLDSIIYALGGAGGLPGVPVHDGKSKADIELRIDSEPPIVVHRRITSKGKTTLEIQSVSEDGIKSKVSSPQKLLDSLCGKIAFDPLAFTRLTPQKQADLLREVVGIDLSAIDDDYQATFAQRAEINREVKQLEAEIASIEVAPDAPDLIVDTAVLMQQIDYIAKANADYEERQREAAKAADYVRTRQNYLEQSKLEVVKLESALAEAVADVKEMEKLIDDAKEKHHLKQQFAESANLTDDSELREQIANADRVNEVVRKQWRKRDLQKAYAKRKAAADAETERLNQLRELKTKRMNEAEWPVEGLGFGGDGVTFGGLPFEQCSSAEQLKISTAIGLSQHPKLKVLLIRDGSLLDAESLAAIGELADEHDAQIWIERVGHGEECSVIIEDGAIAKTEPSHEPELIA